MVEMLLLANNWRTNKIWSASIAVGVSSLRNCGWLVERALFLRNPKGATGYLFLNSCNHIKSLIWVWVERLSGPIDGWCPFSMKIILGTFSIWFLVCHVCVPWCSWIGSRLCSCLWVPRKIVWFRQSTQDATLCPAEIPGKVFGDPAVFLL